MARRLFYARDTRTGQLGLVMLPLDAGQLTLDGGFTSPPPPSAPSPTPTTTAPPPTRSNISPNSATPTDIGGGQTTTTTAGGGGVPSQSSPIQPPTVQPPTVQPPVGDSGHADAPPAPSLSTVALLSPADKRALYDDLLALGGPGGFGLRPDWFVVFSYLRGIFAPTTRPSPDGGGAGGPSAPAGPSGDMLPGGGGGGVGLPSSSPQADDSTSHPSAVTPSWGVYAAIAAALFLIMRRR